MSKELRQHPLVVAGKEALVGCTCGGEHPVPAATLYSGVDACRLLAEDCAALYGNSPVLLISDPDTALVAADALRQELLQAGVNLEVYLLAAKPSATDSLVDKIQQASCDKALIIAAGSGTINDLGKFAADRNGIDYWCLPTAPSMNGYLSSIAAIKVKGVKQTLPALPPKRLYVMPEVIQQAPLKLRQAGFCDVLAKVVSDIDWQCESLLLSGSYCALPAAMMTAVEKSYAEHPEEIGRGDESAVMGLFNGLLLSGVAMSLAGSSAPASGGEHLVSHFWDMRESLTGREAELHGLQVGIGIILSTACYRRLARLDASELAPVAGEKYAATAARIPQIWGTYAAEVEKQFNRKRQSLLQFDNLLSEHWPALQALFQQVRSPEYFIDLFLRTGAPFDLKSLRLSREEFMLAALNSRAIRDRITVLDLADHAGVLEAAAEEVLQLLS